MSSPHTPPQNKNPRKSHTRQKTVGCQQSVCKQTTISLKRFDKTEYTGTYVDAESELCVVFVHDWLDTKDGFHFPRLAAELAKKGFCSLRFDGDVVNKGEVIMRSIEEGVAEIRTAVQYMQELRKKVVALVGHGIGGSKVLLYAQQYDDIDRIININGVFDFNRLLNQEVGVENIKKIHARLETSLTPTPDRKLQKQYKITNQVLTYFQTLDMKKICSSITMGEVLTLHGGNCTIVPVQDAKEFGKHIRPHLLNIIQGADYYFSDAKQQDIMITKTLDFLL